MRRGSWESRLIFILRNIRIFTILNERDCNEKDKVEKNMAINKTMRKILKSLSYNGIEVESARQLANLKAIDPLKAFYRTIDYKVCHDNYEVPVRLYMPGESVEPGVPVLLFFHGGGWVTDSIDNYERICSRMAQATGHVVVSVEYRLAPEYRFPTGLEDCYAVAKAVFSNEFILNVSAENITVMGDSAGGNLAAAVCLMARDRGEFTPKRQILIYPVVNSDYTEDSPYPSVRENGTDFILTAGKMQDYIELYKNTEEDKNNPYFAPIKSKDFSNLPKTLILTAEFDPLRDEGEAYAGCLKKAGNEVTLHRIKDALHGFFALGIKHYHVQESFEYINKFLKES